MSANPKESKPDAAFVVAKEHHGKRLDAALRALRGSSWGDARALIATGKVRVRGATALLADTRVREGDAIEIFLRAPRQGGPLGARSTLPESVIVHLDAQVVVVNKSAGISTVPYEEGERGTLDQLVAALPALRRGSGRNVGPPRSLGVVQRLDKETSGLIVFARTFTAKKILASQLRAHTMERRYLALVNGKMAPRSSPFRIESRFVADRGDGLRGSTQFADRGQEAITEVEVLRTLRDATLVRCTLQTGRTHQIRVHLSENGHPLVGERVYVRRYEGPRFEAPRMMLHAAVLGFVHPVTEQKVRFEVAPPDDFASVLSRLGV